MKGLSTGVVAIAAAFLLCMVRWIPAQPAPFEVTIEHDPTGRPTRIVVSGEATGNFYLGRSLYPKGITNALREGAHETVAIAKGPIQESWEISTAMQGGTYEVALWKRKVDKSKCLAPGGCSVCRQLDAAIEHLQARIKEAPVEVTPIPKYPEKAKPAEPK